MYTCIYKFVFNVMSPEIFGKFHNEELKTLEINGTIPRRR